jgi:hypothetical protein
MSCSRLCAVLFVISSTVAVAANSLSAQEPLAVRIDKLLDAAQTGPASPISSAAEFIRRLSLDLRTSVPTPAELRAFLDDAAPNKREVLIDRWLADPQFSLHWAEVLNVMLMERRPDKHVPQAEWIKYLQMSCFQNKPWTQLAREIFTADGTDPNLRPAAKFWLDREAEPHILTRDVGRIFFGMDLQCAQCHDHPLIEHYAQDDYYGLFAFANRTVLFNDEANKKMLLGEKAEGDAEYKSVFTGDASRSRARLPGGTELAEPHFALGDEYQVAPADKVRSVPKHSRRHMLVAATDGTNAAFNRNFANRVWATFFGRGLVHPVDLHHPHNPAASPEVLDLITQELVAANFDAKFLIRQLLLTQAYQRSFDTPADVAPKVAVAPQQVTDRAAALTALKTASEAAHQTQSAAYEATKTTLKALEAPDKAARDAHQAAVAGRKPLTDAEVALAKTQAQVAAQQTVTTALTDAAAKAAEAVKAIPNDAELATASGVFQMKLQAAQTQLAAFQKTATDQTAAVDQARVKWKELVDAAEAAYAQFVAAAPPWEEAKAKWQAARAETIRIDQQLQAALSQQKGWQRTAEFGQQLAAAAQAEQAVPVAQTAMTTAQQAVAQQETEVAGKTAAVVAAEQGQTAVAQGLAAVQAEHQTQLTLASTVADAIGKTEIALQSLTGDANLTAALEKLKARHPALVEQAKAVEPVVAVKQTELQAATSQTQAAKQQSETAMAELTARKQRMADAAAAMAQAQAVATAARGTADTTWTELTEAWSQQFLARTVKPLSPEQIAWSTMEACGVVEQYRINADAEIEKTIPKANVQADAVQLANRQFAVAQKTRELLAGIPATFVGFYGAGGGQPQDQFFATADQALFVANNATIRNWLPVLANRLATVEDAAKVADELYVSVMTRRPTAAEAASVTQYLSTRAADKPAALQELVWALVASAEFRFNH